MTMLSLQPGHNHIEYALPASGAAECLFSCTAVTRNTEQQVHSNDGETDQLVCQDVMALLTQTKSYHASKVTDYFE